MQGETVKLIMSYLYEEKRQNVYTSQYRTKGVN